MGDRRISIAVYRVVSVSLRYFDAGLRWFDSLPWYRLPTRFLKPTVAVVAWLLAFAFVGGRALEWLVLAAVLFVFTPTVYQATLGIPAEGYGFRFLCTVFGLAYAVLLWRPTNVSGVLSAGVLLTSASAVCLLGYLRYFSGWSLRSLEGPAATVLESFIPTAEVVKRERRQRSRGRWSQQLSELSWVAALGVVVAFPCFISGLAITFLGQVSPLADLLLLGWLVRGDLTTSDVTSSFDFEPHIYRAIANATRNFEGLALVLFAVLGLSLSVIPITEAMEMVWAVVTLDSAAAPGGLYLVNVVISLTSVGAYLIWVWIRELQRITGHLDLWENRYTAFGGPNRPIGLTLPAVVVLFCLAASVTNPNQHKAGIWAVIELIWLFAPVELIMCAGWTDAREMQFPEREDWAIAIGLSAQCIVFWFVEVVGQLPPNAGFDDWFAGMLAPELAFALLGIMSLTHVSDVVRYDIANDDSVRRHASSAYVFGFGLFCIAIAHLDDSDISAAIAVIGGFAVLMGPVLVVAKEFERH